MKQPQCKHKHKDQKFSFRVLVLASSSFSHDIKLLCCVCACACAHITSENQIEKHFDVFEMTPNLHDSFPLTKFPLGTLRLPLRFDACAKHEVTAV